MKFNMFDLFIHPAQDAETRAYSLVAFLYNYRKPFVFWQIDHNDVKAALNPQTAGTLHSRISGTEIIAIAQAVCAVLTVFTGSVCPIVNKLPATTLK